MVRISCGTRGCRESDRPLPAVLAGAGKVPAGRRNDRGRVQSGDELHDVVAGSRPGDRVVAGMQHPCPASRYFDALPVEGRLEEPGQLLVADAAGHRGDEEKTCERAVCSDVVLLQQTQDADAPRLWPTRTVS